MGADAQAKASATRASTVLKVGAILALCVVAYFGYFYEPSPPLLPATGDIGQDLRQRNKGKKKCEMQRFLADTRVPGFHPACFSYEGST